jgi:hypothetical protein
MPPGARRDTRSRPAHMRVRARASPEIWRAGNDEPAAGRPRGFGSRELCRGMVRMEPAQRINEDQPRVGHGPSTRAPVGFRASGPAAERDEVGLREHPCERCIGRLRLHVVTGPGWGRVAVGAPSLRMGHRYCRSTRRPVCRRSSVRPAPPSLVGDVDIARYAERTGRFSAGTRSHSVPGCADGL